MSADEGEVAQKKRKTSPLTIPTSLTLARKVLGENAKAFMTVSRMSTEVAGILASMRAGMALGRGDQRLLGEILAQNARVATMFASYGRMLKGMQESFRRPEWKGLRISMPPPSVLGLQAPLAALLSAKVAKIEELEDRIATVEAAVRQLQEQLDNPDLPEEYKEIVRKLLKDVQAQDYIR